MHFHKVESGEIDIKFHIQDNKYLLEVKDNGIGFPEDIDYREYGFIRIKIGNKS